MAQCADTSNIVAFTYKNKTYELVKELKTWVAAAACAKDRGGYLVEINDLGEQQAIYNGLSNGGAIPTHYVCVPDGGGIGYVWIGATDQDNEGSWKWDGDNDGSGTFFWLGEGNAGAGGGAAIDGAFSYWGGTGSGAVNEPDNYNNNQDYGAIALTGWPNGTISLGSTSEWNDISGSNQLYYIIEYDSITPIHNLPKEEVQIYPIPSSDILNIDGTQIQKVSICNTIGEVVLESNESTINVSLLSKGLYVIIIHTKQNAVLTRKIIIE
jgi:hypothetical protein